MHKVVGDVLALAAPPAAMSELLIMFLILKYVGRSLFRGPFHVVVAKLCLEQCCVARGPLSALACCNWYSWGCHQETWEALGLRYVVASMLSYNPIHLVDGSA